MSSSRFSPALQASDLNDFIAPSQDCIISLNKNSSSSSRLQIKQKENTVSTKPPEEAVKISLKDCLACSGCITSAETVMLEKQSLGDFIARINSDKAVIVSVSPQSRASLAAFFGLPQSQVLRKLTSLFKLMGVKAVYDTSSSRDLSLIEACNEFVSRYQKNQSSSGQEAGASLPMISSACPGWICYAEKTLGSYILPYISSVKSPQQVMGAAIKRHVVEKLGLKPYDVYHVTVMPCYDKKLEAVRDDFIFSVDGKEVTEVDSVLTTGEVLDLIQSKSMDFKAVEESPLDGLKYGLSDDTVDFIGHALALHRDDRYLDDPALDTVKRMKQYAESLARFQGGSPYIYPLYGLGELPQGFARLSAVYGGTYMLNKPECKVEFDMEGKVCGVTSEGETAKCKKVVCDPSYLPNKVRKIGRVVRAIAIMSHPIPNTNESHSVQIILPQKQLGRRSDMYVFCCSYTHNVAPRGKFIAFVSAEAETDNPQSELKPGIDLLGPVDEIFYDIYDRYEPVNEPSLDNCFVSTSYDATTHFETTVTDVLNMYTMITGKTVDLSVDLSAASAAEEY